MPVFTENISYAIAFAAALMALHLFGMTRRGHTPALYLGLTFLAIAAQSLTFGLTLHFARPSLPALYLPGLVLLIGPLSYSFFIAARRPDRPLPRAYWLHLIPAAAVTAQRAAGLSLLNIDLTLIASLAVYSALLARLAFRGHRQFSPLGAAKDQAYIWLLACAALLALGAITELLIIQGLQRGVLPQRSLVLPISSVLKLALIGGLVFGAMQRSRFVNWVYSPPPSRPAAPLTDAAKTAHRAIITRLQAELHARPPGLDNAPTLKDMAARLGVPIRHLSRAINREYTQSYSRYMNVKRVALAKALMRSAPDAPLTAIMYDSGFRTKSSFNREFQSIENQSPTQYRERLAKGLTEGV